MGKKACAHFSEDMAHLLAVLAAMPPMFQLEGYMNQGLAFESLFRSRRVEILRMVQRAARLGAVDANIITKKEDFEVYIDKISQVYFADDEDPLASVDPEALSRWEADGFMGYGSDFHAACADGDLDFVRASLDAGADVNSGNQDFTCLHIAAFHGRSDVVDFLLDAGAEIDTVARGHTPLQFAALIGPKEYREFDTAWSTNYEVPYVQIMRKLVAAGADVDAPTTLKEGGRARTIHMASHMPRSRRACPVRTTCRQCRI